MRSIWSEAIRFGLIHNPIRVLNASQDQSGDDLKRIIQEKVEGIDGKPMEKDPALAEVTGLFARVSESLELAERQREIGNGKK